jgi:hypothetical protein
MSVLTVKINRLGFKAEFQVMKVDDFFHLFWHRKRIGRFLSFRNAVEFSEHLGVD